MPALSLKYHQDAFINASEQYTGLFGGVGNGKTVGACLKIIELAVESPNNLCLVGRQTYPQLRDSTREIFMSCLRGNDKLPQLYPPAAYKFNQSENCLTFWNGSKVIFRHLDEYKSLLSMNLGAFYIDQAEEVDEDVFLTLQSRLRRQGVKRLRGLVTGNPKGFNWIYFKFGMNDSKGSTNYKHGDYYRMITAPTIANIDNLPANYILQLKQSYSKEWFARYVEGRWDAFEGQIFDITQITGYDTLPEMKLVFTACDPAISKEKTACNTAFCTIGIAENGHIYDLETIAGHWSFLETLEQAKKLLQRQKSQYLGVESTAYQKSLFEACNRYFPGVYVVDLKADRDKFRRAKSVSHIISKGLFHTNNRDLLNEMTAFDPDAEGKERKDRVDALVHALHMVQTYSPTTFDQDPMEKYKGKKNEEIFFMMSREKEFEELQDDKEVINYGSRDVPDDPDYY